MGQTQNIEQQIQLLSNLQLGFGIAALLFLALAIFLFFYLHIPQVFNEYRGKSAQKAMEEMAANSSDSGRIVSMDKKSKNKKKGTGQLVQRRHYTDNLTDDLSGRMSQEFGEPTGQMNLNMANSSENNGHGERQDSLCFLFHVLRLLPSAEYFSRLIPLLPFGIL